MNKWIRKSLSSFLVFCLLVTYLPAGTFAAHDSTGRPTDLSGQVYLSVYNGTDFPGEPAQHDADQYVVFHSDLTVGGSDAVFADAAGTVLKSTILDDVVEGTRSSNWYWMDYVWGVYNAEGNKSYFLETSPLRNPAYEQTIIRRAKGLPDGADVSAYELVWYVVKYQTSDSAWHIDGLVKEKDCLTVNYYGNGNTSGVAPNGVTTLQPGDRYTVLGNTGDLQKQIGGNTYTFQGWNTSPDGTGTFYAADQQITVNEDVTLYAQWYLANNYTATVATYLDDVLTGVGSIHGSEVSLAISKDGENYIDLTKVSTGIYSAVVSENGTYTVYHTHDGDYHAVENYVLTVYNSNARVEIRHYSVTYDTKGGVWQGSDDPGVEKYFHGKTVYATTAIPYRPDANFLGWVDQDGNEIAPNGMVTLSIEKPVVLTARWENSINIQVNITINHGSGDEHDNNAATMFNSNFQLLNLIGSVNLPIGNRVYLDELSHSGFVYHYDEANCVTTYTAVSGSYLFTDMAPGVYNIHTAKSHYSHQVSVRPEMDGDGNETGNLIIDIVYNFEPNNYDLNFTIAVDNTVPKELYPQAVNVKVSAWYRKDGVLGWHLITQQEADNPPINIAINPETGIGTGIYPVWQHWADTAEPYFYRLEVSAFVLPDGTIVPASSSDHVTYTIEGNLYTATVRVTGGDVPEFPVDSSTQLSGIYYNAETQDQQGTLSVNITANPYTVKFDAMGGTINGVDVLTFENQFRHLDHNHFFPVRDGGYVFDGWYLDEACTIPAHDDHHGHLLTENVTHYAKWKAPLQISGTVYVSGVYGDGISVLGQDRVKETVVMLEKLEHGVFNQIGGYTIQFNNFDGDIYSGTYAFGGLADDGSVYRVSVVELNYLTTYDNNGDASHNSDECNPVYVNGNAIVDVYLDFEPESYEQQVIVDASAMAEGFRPSSVEVVYLGRDLGDIHPYTTIVQHLNGGLNLTFANQSGSYICTSQEIVWKRHTDGALYEYQVSVIRVDGVDYSGGNAPYDVIYDSPSYWVAYDSPSYWNEEKGSQNAPLKATFVPHSFKVTFDLGLNLGEYVTGMDSYLNADGTYSTTHTWGFEKKIQANPVRPGYYFMGWKCVTDGVEYKNDTIAAECAQNVTLQAVWQEVAGHSYTVYYLDYETGATLHAPVVTEDMREGDVVYAASEILGITGYDFHSASTDKLTISDNSAANVIVLYYVPETGSSGGGMTNPIDDQLHMKKSVILEDDGTYTIRLEVYATSNPISTYLRQDTPLDIVLILDQSGSMYNDGYMDDLQLAADEFISMVASHGRGFGIDHRIAIVGFASNESDGPSDSKNPIAGGSSSKWVNTGIFDSNGTFHNYGASGFTYAPLGNNTPTKDGIYYVLIAGEYGTNTAVYNRLMYHEDYYHLMDATEASQAYNAGEKVYGYVNGTYYSLMLVGSEWTCNGQLYSGNDYYTYYQDVWTHRDELDHRHIHAFGTGSNYRVDTEHDHTDTRVYTRTATTSVGDKSIYVDALMPVSTGKNGTGPINPGLVKAIDGIGGSGGTRTQYGIEMANEIFEANPLVGEHEHRVRVAVVFTDGQPGQSGFDENEANAAIEQAYVTKNTYGAKVYTVGLYESQGVDDISNTSVFMNALSSNYPQAKSMGSAVHSAGYVPLANGTVLDRNQTYYVKSGNSYKEIKYGTVWSGFSRKTGWYFGSSYSNTVVTEQAAPVVTNGKIGSYEVYDYLDKVYIETPNSGFYQTSDNQEELYKMFDNIVVDITTKTSTEIVLHADGIIRDVMGTGLVLTEGTVITATSVPGLYAGENVIVWNEGGAFTFAQLALKNGTHTDSVTLDIPSKDGESVQKDIYQIAVYNTNADNTVSANGPHTVDVSGYDFSTAFISEIHPNGYKLVVDITRVEATDDVIWSHPMSTNNSKSGVWAPMDENGYRELLASFEQPTTIFASRNYVIDYGKPLTLDGWYYNIGDHAGAVHIDTDISDGMNWFDTANTYYRTRYGVVRLVDGNVTYTPTTTKWNGYDSFYVFGDSGHGAIVTQDANSTGNLWTKVVIVPGNNIYYEDSFTSGYDESIDADRVGISFANGWQVEYAGTNPDTNKDSTDDVHGWSQDLSDDLKYSDGSAHSTAIRGASLTFNFTGTGVDVYSRTDIKVGMVVATLKKLSVGPNGEEIYTTVSTQIIDALSVSGTYYQVPVLSFGPVEYGTYQVLLVATSASAVQTGEARYNYYVDGIRIYNPLGDNLTNAVPAIKDSYGNTELNAVFTPIRDILLTNQDFNPELSDGEDGKSGAVFVDWIKDPAGDGSQKPAVGTHTYHIGTYEELGPKNEVYLAPGQTIVLKVDPNNHYYIGMKCLAGFGVTAGVSGLSMDMPVTYQINHATDLYYKVTPVDGYIVITNASEEGSGSLLSLTKLRATNANGLPENGGVISIASQEALQVMSLFMDNYYAVPELPSQPPVYEEDEQSSKLREEMNVAFSDIRQWLYEEEDA